MHDQSQKLNRHVVITGGTRGIGHGLALAFLRSQCTVTISGRSSTSLQQAVEELKKDSGNAQCQGFVCEVTQVSDLEHLWNHASNIKPVDIWINNAGINHNSLLFHEIDKEAVKEVLDINISGLMYATHVAIDGMLKQGFGDIYNMEGLGSDGRMVEGVSIYGSTKRAVRYFTRALIKEYKSHPIHIGTISPGMVVTDLLTRPLQTNPDEHREALKIFHILADRPEKVCPWLVNKILQNRRHGAHIAWLSTQKIAGRFMAHMFKKRKVEGLPDF